MPVELKNVLKVEDPSGLVYYMGTLAPEYIKKLTFVPVVSPSQRSGDESILLNERPDKGYQRAGEIKRMETIAKFVKEHPRCLIPPVVLASRGKWHFTPTAKSDHFGTLQAEDLAAIIDGQHRLGGLLRLAHDPDAGADAKARTIPFMAVDNLPEEEERQEFVNINDNQKGVKKSLIHYLSRDKTFAGRAATALAEDEESVFKGRIGIQKREDWDIFLFGAAKECVDLMFGKKMTQVKKFDPTKDESVQEAAIEFVLKYWKAVRDAMPEFWSDMDKMPPFGLKRSKEQPGVSAFHYRLLEETGIRAFSKLANELFFLTWMDPLKAPAFDAIKEYLGKMTESADVRKALTKPKHDATVLEMDPNLKSTGKAGVDAIFLYLEAELDKVSKHP